MFSLSTFYQSKQWRRLLDQIKNERLNDDGNIICDYCHKPIVKSYDIIGHHIKELTEENVNDYMISLNKDNISLVHHRCHNYIHNKFGYAVREIYLVYGPPLCGARDWVNNVRNDGDLIIDIDSIWECVSGCPRYIKPGRLKSAVFKVRDALIEQAKYRNGKWNNVYIIGGYPLISERERLCKELGAREIYIECTKEECINRLMNLENENILKEEWIKYIENWFGKYGAPLS